MPSLQRRDDEFAAVAEALEAAKAARQKGDNVRAAHTPLPLFEHVQVPLWMR